MPTAFALKQLQEDLQRHNHTVTHTLAGASESDLFTKVHRGRHERNVPSSWGARRDLYWWDQHNWHIDGDADCRVFLETAKEIVQMLQCKPLIDWGQLLPGSMRDTLGSESALHLADCWALILHHLTWTGQLPYQSKIEYLVGESGQDEEFCFTSRLPVDVVQASTDALTLFIEAVEAAEKNAERKPEADAAPSTPLPGDRPAGLTPPTDGQSNQVTTTRPEQHQQPIIRKKEDAGDEMYYLKLWTRESRFSEETLSTSSYTTVDEDEDYFYKVASETIAARLVRLFTKAYGDRLSTDEGRNRFELRFSCHAAGTLDGDDLFLIEERLNAIKDRVAEHHWEWREEQGLCITSDHILLSGAHLLDMKPPLDDSRSLDLDRLHDQAERWEERLTKADRQCPHTPSGESREEALEREPRNEQTSLAGTTEPAGEEPQRHRAASSDASMASADGAGETHLGMTREQFAKYHEQIASFTPEHEGCPKCGSRSMCPHKCGGALHGFLGEVQIYHAALADIASGNPERQQWCHLAPRAETSAQLVKALGGVVCKGIAHLRRDLEGLGKLLLHLPSDADRIRKEQEIRHALDTLHWTIDDPVKAQPSLGVLLQARGELLALPAWPFKPEPHNRKWLREARQVRDLLIKYDARPRFRAMTAQWIKEQRRRWLARGRSSCLTAGEGLPRSYAFLAALHDWVLPLTPEPILGRLVSRPLFTYVADIGEYKKLFESGKLEGKPEPDYLLTFDPEVLGDAYEDFVVCAIHSVERDLAAWRSELGTVSKERWPRVPGDATHAPKTEKPIGASLPQSERERHSEQTSLIGFTESTEAAPVVLRRLAVALRNWAEANKGNRASRILINEVRDSPLRMKSDEGVVPCDDDQAGLRKELSHIHELRRKAAEAAVEAYPLLSWCATNLSCPAGAIPKFVEAVFQMKQQRDAERDHCARLEGHFNQYRSSSARRFDDAGAPIEDVPTVIAMKVAGHIEKWASEVVAEASGGTQSQESVRCRPNRCVRIPLPARECYGELCCEERRTFCLRILGARRGQQGRPPELGRVLLTRQPYKILEAGIQAALEDYRRTKKETAGPHGIAISVSECEPPPNHKFEVEWTQDDLAAILHDGNRYAGLRTEQRKAIKKAVSALRTLVVFSDGQKLLTNADNAPGRRRRMTITLRFGH